MAAPKSSIPSHLKADENNGFEKRHHGKTRSHMVSYFPFVLHIPYIVQRCRCFNRLVPCYLAERLSLVARHWSVEVGGDSTWPGLEQVIFGQLIGKETFPEDSDAEPSMPQCRWCSATPCAYHGGLSLPLLGIERWRLKSLF